MQATALRFATAARTIGAEVRSRGLTVPGFRSPPRLAGAVRTLRRRRDGNLTVSVALRDRPFAAVVADMIEGVVVANGLGDVEATRVRTQLWEALTDVGSELSEPRAAA